ncbi:hypothetical protein FEP65_05666 [Burkholderia multivorans]|nr:hypothetical protein [Burkholderia multivorans]
MIVGGPHGMRERDDPLALAPAQLAFVDVLLDPQRIRRRQLAVDVRIQQRARFVTVHR